MDGESSRAVLRRLYEKVNPPAYQDVVDKALLEGLSISRSSITNVLTGSRSLTRPVVAAFVAGCVRFDEDRRKRAQRRLLAGVEAGQEHWLRAYREAVAREAAAAEPVVPAPVTGTSPSQLLNAEHKVVTFHGREAELAGLAAWRDGGDRLAARWLHGPGGQGKTRLAARFAEVSEGAGWQVLKRDQGNTSPLKKNGRGPLLLVVDYADRLPWTALLALLRDPLLTTSLPTRVLLLARSVEPWPRVQAELGGAVADRVELASLGDTVDARLAAFVHARDCFAARLGVTGARAVGPPGPLDHPGMGLALSLHMAALVAVDAHSRGVDSPADPAHLSRYLLLREEGHWHELAERSRAFTTPPDTMHQAVFTACLTGRLPYVEAKAVASGFTQSPDTVLSDHTRCYPPRPLPDDDGPAALEPLYPDRLAEDFIALCLPGHDGPVRGWASDRLRTLLARDPDGTWPRYADRAVTFLAASSAPDRNPHVAPHLAAILRADPGLAYAAGNAALTAMTHLDEETLAAVADAAPGFSDPRVDVGVYAVMRRVLAAVAEGEVDGHLRVVLAAHAQWAGMVDEAVAHLGAAVVAFRAGTTPEDLYALALALGSLGNLLYLSSDHDGATATFAEAVAVADELVALDPDEYGAQIAPLLADQASVALQSGDIDTALALYGRAVHLTEDLPDDFRLLVLPMTLAGMGSALLAAERPAEALPVLERSVAAFRQLQAEQPRAFDTHFAFTLNQLGVCCRALGRDGEAAAHSAAAIAIGQDAIRATEHVNDATFHSRARILIAAGDLDSAAALVASTADRTRDQRGRHPEQDVSVIEALVLVASALDAADRWREGRPLLAEAVVLAGSASTPIPGSLRQSLARELDDLADRLTAADDEPDAAWAVRVQAVEFAEAAAARSAAGRKTLVQVRESAVAHALGALRFPEAVTQLEALVGLWDRDTERADLAHTVQRLVAALVGAGQVLPDEAGRAALVRAVDTSLRWQPFFTDHVAELPEGVWELLLTSTAHALAFLDRHAESVPAAERAVAAATGATPLIRSWAQQVLALALHRAGRDTDRALAACAEALELMGSCADDSAAFVADIRFTAALLADLLDRAGRPDDAARARAEFGIG